MIRAVSDRIAVMRAGEIVEAGRADDVYANPAHEYTRALLAAVPSPDPRRMRAPGRTPARELRAGLMRTACRDTTHAAPDQCAAADQSQRSLPATPSAFGGRCRPRAPAAAGAQSCPSAA